MGLMTDGPWNLLEFVSVTDEHVIQATTLQGEGAGGIRLDKDLRPLWPWRALSTPVRSLRYIHSSDHGQKALSSTDP